MSIVFLVLVLGGINWHSIHDVEELSAVIAAGGGLIIYDPDMLGVFFVDVLFLFIVWIPLWRRIARWMWHAVAIGIMGIAGFGVFGAPVFVRDHYDARISAAGYTECFDHPAHTSPGSCRSRGLPNQVWVLDPVDCRPGDEWSWKDYRRQIDALEHFST